MALESLVIPAASAALGVVAGAAAALYATHRREQIAKPVRGDPWKAIEEASREKAELLARKKALRKAYASGAMDEHAYVSKDAELTKRTEHSEDAIEAALRAIAQSSLPAEMAEREKFLKNLSDVSELTKKIRDLHEKARDLENERQAMHVRLAEAEEEKKMTLADKNLLKRKFDEDARKLKDLGEKLDSLEAHRTQLQERLAAIPPAGQEIQTLMRENRLLRESLERVREKAKESEKALAVLRTVVERHARQLEELESLTPDQLKSLVNPNAREIRALAKAYPNPRKAFEFVRDSITEVNPNVSVTFWLSPEEVINLRAADPEDKATVLCAMLRALGEEARVAVLELADMHKRSVVLTSDSVLDPVKGKEFDSFTGLSWEEALRKYEFHGVRAKRIVFEFNDKIYRAA
jgi:myosin heavy subunit